MLVFQGVHKCADRTTGVPTPTGWMTYAMKRRVVEKHHWQHLYSRRKGSAACVLRTSALLSEGTVLDQSQTGKQAEQEPCERGVCSTFTRSSVPVGTI